LADTTDGPKLPRPRLIHSGLLPAVQALLSCSGLHKITPPCQAYPPVTVGAVPAMRLRSSGLLVPNNVFLVVHLRLTDGEQSVVAYGVVHHAIKRFGSPPTAIPSRATRRVATRQVPQAYPSQRGVGKPARCA
jgi:hypothetical protein